MNPDVVIVGAGPVGLFSAIEMKLENPTLQIKILERNTEYSRHHILRLEESSLRDSKAYALYEKVRELNGFVPTSQIENTFLEIAKDLGVEIERGVKVDNATELLKKYPTARSIVGADGAHSKIREQLFDNEKVVDNNLQYIVEIKYKAKGFVQKLPTITYINALGQVNHLVSESVGKERDGLTPVSLFVFVSEKTYLEIRHSHNAKLADLHPTTNRMKSLLNTIQPWLALRKVSLNEDMVPGSESINGVALNVYQSKYFAKKMDEKNIYLVGDAGAAVPYFRALNAGLISARVVAREIACKLNPNLEQLNCVLSNLTQAEISNANIRNKQVDFGRGANKFLANVSKIPTGALLKNNEERAMLNARVNRTNILRRNPRVLMSLVSIILLSLALVPVLLPVIMSVMSTVLVSIALSTAAITLMAAIIEIVSVYNQNERNKNNPIEPLNTFQWEMTDEQSSSSSLGFLSKSENDEHKDGFNKEPKHHQHPLSTNLKETQPENPERIGLSI